jgi:signal peptidase I
MKRLRTLLRSARLRSWLKSAFVVMAVLAFRSSVASAYWVPTGSMEPTILPGDRIVATKCGYGLRLPFTAVWLTQPAAPARGDIVVFPSPVEPDVDLVKRVVAIEGDVLEGREGRLILNGVLLPLEVAPGPAPVDGSRLFVEDLEGARHLVREIPGRPSLRNFPPTRIPPGHFFAMGDNRDDSADSRVFGPVPFTSLRGHGRRILWSLDSSRAPYLRFGRFGAPLE